MKPGMFESIDRLLLCLAWPLGAWAVGIAVAWVLV